MANEPRFILRCVKGHATKPIVMVDAIMGEWRSGICPENDEAALEMVHAVVRRLAESGFDIQPRSPRAMSETGREICLRYAEFKHVPESEREAWALRFWEASTTGELSHVFKARDEMDAAGFQPRSR